MYSAAVGTSSEEIYLYARLRDNLSVHHGGKKDEALHKVSLPCGSLKAAMRNADTDLRIVKDQGEGSLNVVKRKPFDIPVAVKLSLLSGPST